MEYHVRAFYFYPADNRVSVCYWGMGGRLVSGDGTPGMPYSETEARRLVDALTITYKPDIARTDAGVLGIAMVEAGDK